MNDNETDKNNQNVNSVAKIENVVPKFCTNINMGLCSNKRNVVMSMIYNENDENNNNSVLIDRIIVDIDLIIAMKNTFEQMLKDIEDEK